MDCDGVGVKGIREVPVPSEDILFFACISCVFYVWLEYMHAARIWYTSDEEMPVRAQYSTLPFTMILAEREV